MKVGIDLTMNERFMNKDLKFVQKILSQEEQKRFLSFSSDKRRTEYLASRFAAKEALFKANHMFDINHFNEVSILNDENGAPYVYYSNKKRDEILISLSHETLYSVAIVLLKD